MVKCLMFCLAWFAVAIVAPAQAQSQASSVVRVLEVQGAISPATADFITTGIAEAEASGAHLLILELDTPGGLDASMRAIIRRMLSAQLPIVVYVAPGGARAASAGTFILYASHIAAMTPASNLGAASPVAVGTGLPGQKPPEESKKGEEAKAGQPKSTMEAKVANDAAAYIRSLAELRGRDPNFAEAAVREARSLSAGEAQRAGVIEIIAPSLDVLLTELNGREVTMANGQTLTLATVGAQVERVSPDWRHRLLAFLANPQLAVILLMLGIYGLFFEMMSPGAALPGVAGLICLLLGLYGLHMLPVNWAGVALLCLGLLMMIGEVFLPSFGALGVGGLLAVVLGGLFMTGPDVPNYYELSIPFLVSVGLASAVIIIGAGTVAIRSRRSKTVTGREAMVGARGRVVGLDGRVVYAEIHGENWRVICDEPLELGDEVMVTAAQDLKLRVQRVVNADAGSSRPQSA
ncbi:MAG TPA: nodulation protein NfeD [Burkholderiaceae bacterium]|nr:nodulation protein NfeD [Burkholderiaceae bacterium]